MKVRSGQGLRVCRSTGMMKCWVSLCLALLRTAASAEVASCAEGNYQCRGCHVSQELLKSFRRTASFCLKCFRLISTSLGVFIGKAGSHGECIRESLLFSQLIICLKWSRCRSTRSLCLHNRSCKYINEESRTNCL